MSTVEWPPAMASRTNGRSRNARSLFISGLMTWARAESVSSSYQDQNPRSTGSVTAAVDPAAERLVGEQLGQVGEGGDAWAWVRRVRQAARMTSSVRGPQNAEKTRRKTDTRLSTGQVGLRRRRAG